jgi:hypothetical protein
MINVKELFKKLKHKFNSFKQKLLFNKKSQDPIIESIPQQSIVESIPQQSIIELVSQQVIESIPQKLIVEPVSQQVIEPVSQQVIEPVSQQVIEPVSQQVIEPVSQHIIEPVSQHIIEPVSQHIIEPVSHPVVDSIIESVVKPGINNKNIEQLDQFPALKEDTIDDLQRNMIIDDVFRFYKKHYHEFYSTHKTPIHSNFNEVMFKTLCNKFYFKSKNQLLEKLHDYNIKQKSNACKFNHLSKKRKLKCDMFNFYIFI